VLSFFRVRDEATAIARSNDSPFGPDGSVSTKAKAPGKRFASQVDTGMMCVANIDWCDADLPVGSIKGSGYERELGHIGIQEFVKITLVRTGQFAAPI